TNLFAKKMSNSRNNNDFRPQRGHHYGQSLPNQGDQYRPYQDDQNRQNQGDQYRPNQGYQYRPYQGDQNRQNQGDQYRPNQAYQYRPNQGDQYRPNQGDQYRTNQGDQYRPNQEAPGPEIWAPVHPYPHQGEQGRPYRPFNNNRYYEQEDERRKRSFAIIGLRPLLGTPTLQESQVEDCNAAIDICRYLDLLLRRKRFLSRNEETRYLRLEKAFTREEIANRYGQPGDRMDSNAESN
uniref:FMR1-interacting protein 1 conserved domain-containing protein n=2 Tax=Panagrolaimus sp. PS1159 TaxID=55785 RepID=A0AC35F2K0_9BILA